MKTRTQAILFAVIFAIGAHGQDAQGTTPAQLNDYLTNDKCYWPNFTLDPGFKLCPIDFGVDSTYWNCLLYTSPSPRD